MHDGELARQALALGKQHGLFAPEAAPTYMSELAVLRTQRRPLSAQDGEFGHWHVGGRHPFRMRALLLCGALLFFLAVGAPFRRGRTPTNQMATLLANLFSKGFHLAPCAAKGVELQPVVKRLLYRPTV